MNFSSFFQCKLFPCFKAKISYPFGFVIEVVVSDQYSLFPEIIIGRIKYLGELIVCMRNAPVDMFVFLPEPSLKLQADLAGIYIWNEVNGTTCF